MGTCKHCLRLRCGGCPQGSRIRCAARVQSAHERGRRLTLSAQRELLDLTDGAKVALDWAGAVRKGAPTLVLLHGLTGGSQEAYIQWIVEAARQRGIQSVVFNARGCGGSRLYTPLGFNAARTVDLHEVVQHVQVCVGEDTPLFAVGVSLGAGILVKYLGEMGSGAPFRAAGAHARARALFRACVCLGC